MANDPISYARTTQVRLRRGTTAQIAANPPIEAEPFYDLTENRIGVGGTTEIIEQWKSQFLEHTADATDAVARNLQEKLTEIVSVKDFGAVGDGVTDDTVAIQDAINSGLNLKFPPGVYLCNSIDCNNNNQTFAGYGSTLKFNGNTTNRLIDITGDWNHFFGIKFSGADLQPRSGLVFVDDDVDSPAFIDCEFSDILGQNYGATVLNQTCGLLISPYGVTDFIVDRCRFKNLRKYNDGSFAAVTAGYGFIGGIYFMKEDLSNPTATQTVVTRGIVSNCAFDTIKTILQTGLSANDVATYDDGDAIRTYAHTGGAEELYVTVVNSNFINCSKRALKFRASGGIARGITIDSREGAYAMSATVDIVHNCEVSDLRVLTSSSLPPQKIAQLAYAGQADNQLIKLSRVFAGHSVVGIDMIPQDNANTWKNVLISDVVLESVSSQGITVSSPLAATQFNIRIKNVHITGTGNNARGLNLVEAVDVYGGFHLENIYLKNCDAKIGGVGNEIDGFRQDILSATYAGFSASQSLFELAPGKTYGSFNRVSNSLINCPIINANYVNAARQRLVLMSSDNMTINNLEVIVPDTLSDTYQHVEFLGDNISIDGYNYTGDGLTFIGTTLSTVNGSMNNCVRKGSGACSKQFIYMNNASSQYVSFNNIVDFRPTTASTVDIVVGSNTVANNVITRSSNINLVNGLTTQNNIDGF